VNVQRDFGAAVDERSGERAGIELAAADERLQVDLMDVQAQCLAASFLPLVL
jgi:hypothetical protein